MQARLHVWWQKTKQHPYATGFIVLLILILFIFLAYRFGWDWTGFNGKIKSGKTLWDWLQLLIVPLVLAVIALLFNRATIRAEQKIAAARYEQDKEIASRHYHQDRQIAEQRYQNDRSIALDKQREDLLPAYLSKMSDLLIKEGLRHSARNDEVRHIARSYTLTVLHRLDLARKGSLLQFLYPTFRS